MADRKRCVAPHQSSSLTPVSSFGAAAITFGLPVLLYFFYFACNDVSGCPVPSLLGPRTLSWEAVRTEIGWPGVRGLFSLEVTGVVLFYYLATLILWRVLPAQEAVGTKLVQHGRPLRYRFNGEHAQSWFNGGPC